MFQTVAIDHNGHTKFTRNRWNRLNQRKKKSSLQLFQQLVF